ncbi:transcriptional regulator [Lactococcus hodotermopsidis]|uniref:Transcriptional regulator n=1 Tax=Pseudolactococcus hodotermopsidis TaxID=2709157 RepID=A0A6A0BF17_9LACT|nr:Rgg/GadR/MutR family transcriptional regulator [Lactococcus hodotermopsidis]GFH43044.1 transcriptional regulator [Lactococcus hodotermopsidis]
MSELQDLGTFYREKRVSRGYSLNDIESDYLDKGQVSRFENGLAMLSAEALVYAIEGINMTPSEFFTSKGNYDTGILRKFGNEFQSYMFNCDAEGLRSMIIASPRRTDKKLFNVIVKCAIRDITTENLLTSKDTEFIDKYLTNIENWTIFEVNIFSLCLEALDIDLARDLGKEMIKRDKLYKVLAYNAFMVKEALINLYCHMILHGKYYYAEEFEKELEKLLTPLDVKEKIFFHIFKKIGQYRQEGKAEALAEIKKDIEFLKAFDLQVLADRVEMLMTNYE